MNMKFLIFIGILFSLTSFVYNLTDFIDTNCNKNKTCIKWSECLLGECDYAASWKQIVLNGLNYTEFEIVGKLSTGSNQYIALGFSNDDKMSNDGVVGCSLYNNQLSVKIGFNAVYVYNHINVTDLDNNILIINKNNEYGVEFNSTNLMLRCRFARLTKPNLRANDIKDLSNNTKYYILTASGTIGNAMRFIKHSAKRVSSDPFDLSQLTTSQTTTVNQTLIKLHGTFMIVGWILFFTNGIVIGNFYKLNWAKTMCKKAIWFELHIIFQTFGMAFVIAAAVFIFIQFKFNFKASTAFELVHRIVGIIALILMIINPFMAIFRCKPKSAYRIYFNIFHYLVGGCAYCLALTAIIIGIQLKNAGPRLSKLNYPWIIACVYLGVILLLNFYAEIRLAIINRKNNPIKESKIAKKYKMGVEVIVISEILSIGFGVVLIIFVSIH